MNNHASRNILKVDAVSAPLLEDRKQKFLVIYNINVPVDYIQNGEAQARAILTRIKNLLIAHFLHFPVVYQITASYNLVHSITGEFRVWTGSFSVRDNEPAQITGFEHFDPDTFVDESIENLEDFEFKLVRAPELSSNWVLNSVNSIIFNVQSVVDPGTDVVATFPRNGQRAHRTFALP
jgi:hypothetical protein